MESHSEREHEVARARIAGIIRGKLMEGAEDVLKNAHVDAMVIDDRSNHHSEHVISRDEADAIVRAEWSAGEDTMIENITDRIVDELDKLGFDFHASELPEVSLVLRSSA